MDRVEGIYETKNKSIIMGLSKKTTDIPQRRAL